MNSLDYLIAKGFSQIEEDDFGCCYKLPLVYGILLQIRLFNKGKVIDILRFDYTEKPYKEGELFIGCFDCNNVDNVKRLNDFLKLYDK